MGQTFDNGWVNLGDSGHLKVIEFDVEYDFETAKEAESSVEEIIQSLIETRVKKQKLELPIPFFASHSAMV